MAEKTIQEAPATLAEAWNQGMRNGLELQEAKKQMRECIAHRLQSCRLAARMTQQELAMRTNINHLTYRGYENCRSDIPIVHLVRLADEFDVSLDYLTGRTDNKNEAKSGKDESAKADTDARISQLEKMVAQLMSTQGNQ